MIQIEKGIPAPKRSDTNISAVVKQLEVGDSFVVGEENISAIYQAALRANFKVSRRTTGDGQFRVWRIA